MVSFSLGTLVGYTGVEVTFLRGGAVVASEVLGDGELAACDQRLSRTWSVPDGFDTVRFASGGLQYGITDLESCYVDSGSR